MAVAVGEGEAVAVGEANVGIRMVFVAVGGRRISPECIGRQEAKAVTMETTNSQRQIEANVLCRRGLPESRLICMIKVFMLS